LSHPHDPPSSPAAALGQPGPEPPLLDGMEGIDPAGATVQNPQALRWSRVVPLWRWLLYMLVGGFVYQMYWFYHSWRLIAAYRRAPMRPLLRAFFTIVPVYIAEFYAGVFGLARSRGYPENPPVLPLSLVFVLFWFTSKMAGGMYALLELACLVLLIPAAEALNFFWASVEEGQPVHRGANPLEIGIVGLGAGLMAFALYVLHQSGGIPK